MDPLASLSALGPWGVLVGVAVTLAAQFLRNRLPSGPAPVPPPSPAPAPHGTPVLDALLALLRARFTAPAQSATVTTTAAPVADLDHETAADVLSKLFQPKK